MSNSRGRRRGALAWLLLAVSPCALALNPALDVSQYAHTAWKIRDGFSKGVISSIAQTPDGYLWLGTEFGLLRFDGVRNVPWQPPPDQQLPSSKIISLLAALDGTLWIGSSKGLVSWKSGKLTQYAELAGQNVARLLEDREGSVWAGASAVPTGRLCVIPNGCAQCYGEDGGLGLGVLGLYEDRKGNRWAGVPHGLWRWKPGPPKFHPMPGGLDRFRDFAVATFSVNQGLSSASSRRCWRPGMGAFGSAAPMAWNDGITRILRAIASAADSPPHSLFEDSRGRIWVTTRDGVGYLEGERFTSMHMLFRAD